MLEIFKIKLTNIKKQTKIKIKFRNAQQKFENDNSKILPLVYLVLKHLGTAESMQTAEYQY